jgi:hypothetical protein
MAKEQEILWGALVTPEMLGEVFAKTNDHRTAANLLNEMLFALRIPKVEKPETLEDALCVIGTVTAERDTWKRRAEKAADKILELQLGVDERK